MPNRLWDRIRDWVILFVLLATSVGIMLTLNTPLLRSFRAIALDVTGIVEARFAWAGNFLRALDENEALRQSNIALSSELARSRAARQENERLRRLLEFREGTALEMKAARVVSKDVFRQDNYLTLDVGRNDSVEVGMAVIDERGILGKVVLVSEHYSRVMPYLNTDFRVPAKVQPLDAAGILRWQGTNPDQLLLEHIVKTQPVEENQLVVVSDVSSVFPAGYPIGRIDSFVTQPGRNAFDIFVKPLAPLSTAEHAFVVLRLPEPELEKLEAEPIR